MVEQPTRRRSWLWRTSNTATKGPGLVCRPSKASTSMRASSCWSTLVCSSSTLSRAGSRRGYGGFTGRSWAGALAWEHTPWASSASVGAGLGSGMGGTQDQGDDGQGRRIVRKRTLRRKNHSAPGRQTAFTRVAIGRVATGAGALGALAVGAGAFGALAIGALAIRALAIKRGRIERLNIGELEVGTLHVRELVVEQEQTPRQDATVSTS